MSRNFSKIRFLFLSFVIPNLHCTPSNPPANSHLLRLARQTADASRLDYDRELFKPEILFSQLSNLKWSRELNFFQTEIQVTPGVEYMVRALANDDSARMDIRRSGTDSEEFGFWESALVRKGQGRVELVDRTQASGSRMQIRFNAPLSHILALQIREASHRSPQQLASSKDADIRAYIFQTQSKDLSHILESLLATGPTTYEWELPSSPHPRVFSFDISAVKRHIRPGEHLSPLEMSVQLRKRGTWQTAFSKTFQQADVDSPWQSSSLLLEDATAIRLQTKPQGDSRRTVMVAWGMPTVHPEIRSHQKDVIFFTLDALRADHVGAFGSVKGLTPTLDQLAQKGAAFEEARTARGETWESLTAMAYATWPEESGVIARGQLADRGIKSISSIFSEAGYQVGRIGNYLLPPGQLGAMDFEEETHDDKNSLARLKELFSSPHDRPLFLWVHLAAPHYPYNPEQKFLPKNVKPLTTLMEFAHILKEKRIPKERDRLRLLYEASVRQTDSYIAEILPLLTRPDRPGGPAILSFSADHGSHQGERGVWFLHSTYVRSVLHVPLIFFGPGIRQARVSKLVRTIDIGPTLLDYAGLPNKGFTGETLRGLIEGRVEPGRTNVVRIPKMEIVVAENDRFKMAANPRGYQGFWPEFGSVSIEMPPFELYRWREDPNEERNLFSEMPLVLGEMWKQVSSGRATLERPVLPEVRRLLIQAGYAESENSLH